MPYLTCPHCLRLTTTFDGACLHCGRTIPDDPSTPQPDGEIPGDTDDRRLSGAAAAAPETAQPSGTRESGLVVELPTRRPIVTRYDDLAAGAQLAPLPTQDTETATEPEPATGTTVEPMVAAPARTRDSQMQLSLRRDRKIGTLSRRATFTLDVRVELSPEMCALVKRYEMEKQVLHQLHRIEANDRGLWSPVSVRNSRAKKLRITVDDLINGMQITCNDILEMYAVEGRIREACITFKDMLASVGHLGGEEVIDI
jgi:hypothetical protein